MKNLVVFLFIPFLFLNALAYDRNILQKEAEKINLAASLIDDFDEIEFPKYTNRDFWTNLPNNIRNEYIVNAEEFLNYDWPVVKATDYLEIIRSGERNQGSYAAPRKALLALVMGELTEGEGRFIDQIVNGVWYYSEQTWWGWSAHLSAQKAPHGLPDANEPTIDLGVGEVTNILSWTWFLFKDEFDKIHPLIASRLKDEIMKKAVLPYYNRDDFWWMGLTGNRTVNNWNPWTNHNLLTAILILEDNKEKKVEAVNKVIKSLDQFINYYPDDGGCDEGPSYWGRAGASLFQCLDLLDRATKGKFNVYDDQLIKNMGSYIYKAYINYPYFINFADADAMTGSRPEIIYWYGKAIKDPVMRNFGAYLSKKQNWGERIPLGKIDEQIIQLMYLEEIKGAEAENALVSEFWLPDTEIAGARDAAGTAEGFFFAAKGGFNAESHNHNDVGTCVLYYNGKPCLVDIGRETYTAKTFSNRRYEIWTMQSQYHNLPTINGIEQKEGAKYKASDTRFESEMNKVTFKTNLVNAYPQNAEILKWERSYTLNRGKDFTITDDYVLKRYLSPSSLNFVTSCRVTNVEPGLLELNGDDFVLAMNYDPELVSPRIEINEITDSGLKRYWDNITRIVFVFNDRKLNGENKVVISKFE